jgi:restriction endonuclease S subunit
MFLTVEIVVLCVTPCGVVAVYKIRVAKGVTLYTVTKIKKWTMGYNFFFFYYSEYLVSQNLKKNSLHDLTTLTELNELSRDSLCVLYKNNNTCASLT